VATKKTAHKAPVKKAREPRGSSGEVHVRMYRQGLGDCFLITLPRKGREPFYLMIDCGVILGTPHPADLMAPVVRDIAATTKGHVDLLLATHEHWDHLSGFVQVRDLFNAIHFENVWLAWTEDPMDSLANQLRDEHQKLRAALTTAAVRLHIGGNSDGALTKMLEFFGAAGQGTTGDALKVVKGFCKNPRFCRPSDEPVEFENVDARLYILGPPHDLAKIKRFNPSKANPETYGLAQMFLDGGATQLVDSELNSPFDPIVRIPFEAAGQARFFQDHYWGECCESAARAGEKDIETDQSWRRIDGAWLDASSSLALQLDSATNNTSLVLAIELGDGRVLLFAADAQVGNWLSWQDLEWEVNGEKVTGPDLLSRTVLYKTGHHGSHNATLKDKGLELMKRLEIALIPVDHQMAIKKGWDKIPLEELENVLNRMTGGRVLRIDRPIPSALQDQVTHDPGEKVYYEVSL